VKDRSNHGIGYVAINLDITERKQAEQQILESEARHRIISGLISDHIYKGRVFVDRTSETNWVSGAFEQITGYTFEEIQTLPNGFFALVLPENLFDLYFARSAWKDLPWRSRSSQM
jgi:PAS domain-containing protein